MPSPLHQFPFVGKRTFSMYDHFGLYLRRTKDKVLTGRGFVAGRRSQTFPVRRGRGRELLDSL
eukprot:207669-Rhodomonas_salina.1